MVRLQQARRVRQSLLSVDRVPRQVWGRTRRCVFTVRKPVSRGKEMDMGRRRGGDDKFVTCSLSVSVLRWLRGTCERGHLLSRHGCTARSLRGEVRPVWLFIVLPP